jgi:protein-arginine kinase activator protein McsA
MKLLDYEYDMLKNAKAPKYCQRCWLWDAKIRVIKKEEKTVEFICELCKDEDKKLKHEKVIAKPKPKKWYQLF